MISDQSGAKKRSTLFGSSFILSLLLTLGILSTLSIVPTPHAAGQTLGAWNATTGLPPGASQASSYGTSCATHAGYVYCLAGNNAYYASISLSGIGIWSSTTSYPRNPETGPTEQTVSEICVTSSGYIYCIGGEGTGSGSKPSDAVVYAPVSSSGIGSWAGTTHYPIAGPVASCVVSGGYIYCIKGVQTYYAPILPNGGVGTWNQTMDYPTTNPGCVASGPYIYCIGGSTSYYASASSSGVGPWTTTTAFPVSMYGSTCAVSLDSYLYCIGGYSGAGYQNLVYYAPLSSSGIGNWTATTSYPATNFADAVGCMIPDDYIYCIGYQSSYFAPITSPYPTSSLAVLCSGH